MSQHPIIVVEGSDGTGKTTLCDELCRVLDSKYVHLTYRFRDRMHLYHGAALKYALTVAETRPVVLDRWWASERVYADVYRGGTRWPLMDRHLERAALRHGVSYVFAVPCDRERYLAHYDKLKTEREEMYDEGMERVYDGFEAVHDRLYSELRPAVLRYDLFTDGRDLDDFVGRVVQSSMDYRATLPECALDLRFRNLSGSPSHCRDLVVGDCRHMLSDRRAPPLTEYTEDTWGLRWSRALERAKVPESSVCWIDAHDQSHNGVATELIRDVSRHARVWATSDDVVKWLLDRVGVFVYGTIRHPRYWDATDG